MEMVRKIVLVEDEQPQRELVQMVLEGEGYAVQSAESAEEGLRCIETQQPDIVITDVKLPAMDGFSLFTHVRDNLGLSQIPFVFITGYNNPETIQNIAKFQSTAYLTKPYELTDLLFVVDNLLTRSSE